MSHETPTPNNDLTILGNTVRGAVQSVETFARPAGCDRVRIDVDEFTSFCPKTGQPDFATLRIEYIPSARCVETKSLKLYLQSFRERGHFVEALAEEIADHLQSKLEAQELVVNIQQSTRGGMRITAIAVRSAS